MKKQLVLPVLLAVLVLGFAFPNSALAVAGEPIAGVDTELGKNLGGLMASADLGVDSVGTLPTSPFYFLKEWKRGITRFFTFDAVAKAQLELDITNQIAAEVLEVAKTSSSINYTGLERALRNYTDAQDRLNARLSGLTETSENPNVAELLKKVDDKTALHAALLQQLDANTASSTAGIRAEGLAELVGDVMKRANENTLKTFTITVTPVNDAPSLKQKAEDQIKLAGVAISDVPAGTIVLVVRGMVLPPPTDDESNIFDRWGSLIAKAKSRLESAKEAFAEGKYGEAYGLARSAQALSDGIRVAAGDVNGDGTPELKVAPTTKDAVWDDTDIVHVIPGKAEPATPPTDAPKQPFKISENESPRPSDRAKEAPKATTTDPTSSTGSGQASSPQATPEDEKTETSPSAGSSAGSASNYGRDN